MCRKCGGPLRGGYVEADGMMAPATIYWYPEAVNEYAIGEELAPLPFWRFSSSPRFPALLCPKCSLIEFSFSLESSKPHSR
jgi:hypothetical protein